MTSLALPWLLGWYIVLSVLAFAMYGADKSAAIHGRRRTSEAGLHIVSLLGGWPGALVAQQVFRHKTRKVSFQVTYWITVMLNIGLLVMLLSAGAVTQG